MRNKILSLLVISLLMACSSDGGGSANSTTYSGTGFLKVDLPQPASIGSTSANSLVEQNIIDSKGTAPLTYLQLAIQNTNNGLQCSGTPENIPFVICMIESYGINSVGTYNGTTPSGANATATVSNLSGNSNGYTLKAEVTLDSSNEKVFLYMADSNGEKGVVEMLPNSIFGDQISNYAIRIVWDKTTSPEKITYTYDSISSERNSSAHMIALLQGPITDIAYKSYDYVSSLPEASSIFSQLRSNSSKTLSLTSICTDSSSPTEGTDCFDFSSTSLFDVDSNGKQLECYESSSIGSQSLQIADSISLDSTAIGSMSFSANFSDSDCESLVSTNTNGGAFSIRIDKNDSSADTINGIAHDLRNLPYNEMTIINNNDFLN